MGLLVLVQCERPNSPDFTLSRTIEFPFLKERTIPFIGTSDALIDTTSESFRDLFIVDEESFVRLSRVEDFDFGNLDNAIPALEFEPEQLNATVGPIVIRDFSSGDDLGSAGFESMTGLQSDNFSAGDNVPPGSTPQPVNIDLDTDYFVSATIIEGGLIIELKNELGFDIDNLTLAFKSGETEIGTTSFSGLSHDQSESLFLDLSGTQLENLNVDITASWQGGQEFQDEPGDLIVKELAGQNLIASEVVAAIGQQEFTLADEIAVDVEEFRFETADHFVEIETGALRIFDIVNQLDVGLDLVVLSFPDIRSYPYNDSDLLVIELEGDERFARSSTSQNELTVDLGGYRIYGEGNRIEYTLFVHTEDTRSGEDSEPRSINQDDSLSASIEISDFNMARAFGIVSNRMFFLNEDDPASGTGRVDIFNDNEAQQIEVDGLRDFSGKIDGLEFTDAGFSINYQTNVGIPVTVIGAFAGIAENGELVYLAGKEGEETYVNDIEKAEGLLANGTQLDAGQLTRFTVEPAPGETHSHSFTFDRNNSNIVEFLNHLPSEIRFIGMSDLNRDQVEGTIVNPVVFEPAIALDIPMAIQTLEEAVFTDTITQEFDGLPGEDEDHVIAEGTLYVIYRNHFPVNVSLNLEFLGANNERITTVPLQGEEAVAIRSADANTAGFSVEEGYSSRIAISLNNEQLRHLNRTENVSLSLGLTTFEQQEVRLRATDHISISLNAKFVLESTVK